MSWVDVLRYVSIFFLKLVIIKVLEFLKSMFVYCADWLGKVSEHSSIVQIELFCVIIQNNPREDGILTKIIEASTRNCIQIH